MGKTICIRLSIISLSHHLQLHMLMSISNNQVCCHGCESWVHAECDENCSDLKVRVYFLTITELIHMKYFRKWNLLYAHN